MINEFFFFFFSHLHLPVSGGKFIFLKQKSVDWTHLEPERVDRKIINKLWTFFFWNYELNGIYGLWLLFWQIRVYLNNINIHFHFHFMWKLYSRWIQLNWIKNNKLKREWRGGRMRRDNANQLHIPHQKFTSDSFIKIYNVEYWK